MRDLPQSTHALAPATARTSAMEALYFMLMAVALYFAADRALDYAERRAGRRFEYRTVIFFALLLGLALAGIWVMRRILTGSV